MIIWFLRLFYTILTSCLKLVAKPLDLIPVGKLIDVLYILNFNIIAIILTTCK